MLVEVSYMLATGVEIALGVGLLATTAIGAASAAGAFSSDPPSIPTRGDPDVVEERRKAVRLRASQRGHRSTILTPPSAAGDSPAVARPTTLGGGPQPGSPI